MMLLAEWKFDCKSQAFILQPAFQIYMRFGYLTIIDGSQDLGLHFCWN